LSDDREYYKDTSVQIISTNVFQLLRTRHVAYATVLL